MSVAFLDKAELKSSQDLLKLQQLMDTAVEQVAQKNPQTNTEEFRNALKTLTANAMAQMQLFITTSDTTTASNGTPLHALKSPMLKPLSPPPVDAEVKALEYEVEESSKRVGKLRENMQTLLQDRLTTKLAECRPSAEVTPPEPLNTAAMDQDNEENQLLSPDAEDLQQRLGETAARLPELRARLEQATQRLKRVVTAVTDDMARGAPTTVERVMLGGKTPGGDAGGEDKNEVERQDVEPVPCPLTTAEDGADDDAADNVVAE